MSAGLPYRVYGGLRFFERAEIKDVIAYLRLLLNPHDDVSFQRVVNVPPRGIGRATIAKLQATAKTNNQSCYSSAKDVSGKPGKSLGIFTSLINGLREKLHSLSLGEIVNCILDESGLKTFYAKQKDNDEKDRVGNLNELVVAAERFVGQDLVSPDEDFPMLSEFLAYATLAPGDDQEEPTDDVIQLMTVHAAKGLEFDCVFIAGLEENLFPHGLALDEPDGLEEERRLMYVGITRARKYLNLSYALRRASASSAGRSSFLNELPETCVCNTAKFPNIPLRMATNHKRTD